MPNKPAIPGKPIIVELTPAERAALVVAAERGIQAVEAFHLVQNTGAMEKAFRKLRDARVAR